MTPTDPDLARIAKLQARHQNILIVLSVVVAVSAMVAWKSMSTLHEFNELQKQSLAGRKPDAPAKTALRPRAHGISSSLVKIRMRQREARPRTARRSRVRIRLQCERVVSRHPRVGLLRSDG
jgi:hypothetical protein